MAREWTDKGARAYATLARAAAAWRSRAELLCNRRIDVRTRLRHHSAAVGNVALCNAGWTLYTDAQLKKLWSTQRRQLLKILAVHPHTGERWEDFNTRASIELGKHNTKRRSSGGIVQPRKSSGSGRDTLRGG